MEIYRKEDLIASGKAIGIRRADNCIVCKEHTHDYIELVYIADGTATEIIDGVTYDVSRGDILFINCGATHAFSSTGGFSHIELFFSPRLIEQGVLTEESALTLLSLSVFDRMRGEQEGGVIRFQSEDRREVEFILDAMLREQALGAPCAATVTESYFSILLTKMLRGAVQGTSLSEDVFESLRTYIDEHPEEKLSLSALAAKCFYHPSYLSRVFKQRFGLSPTEYVRGRRLALAAELLISTDASVDAVMEQVGYTDRTAFYQSFAKHYGQTPAEYRKGKKNIQKG